jgi:branched-chain amino acid transport system permease protein
MAQLVQVVVDGIANGSIYAALALALVLIYRSTGVVNFAQGEMAMFSTFLTWGMTNAGVSLPLAILAALAMSFGGGALIERIVIRPVEGRQPLTLVIVTLGLFILINNAAGWIWGFSNRAFPAMFPEGTVDLGAVRLSTESLGIVGVLLAVVGVLFLLFQRTRIGLAMRAAALDPVSSRLVGIRVGRMLMLGWGLAATVGAIAGILVAPRLFLDVNLMGGVLVYAFAAATLGGFDSALGAVLGGWIIGVSENLAGTYVDVIGSDLKILVPLGVILAVLLVRPTGLLGTREVERA